MTIEAYNPDSTHVLFPHFCPCKDCPYYLDLDNYITKDGTYSVKNGSNKRQRFYCHGGGHRFSEMAYSPLFGHHGSFKEYTQTAKMSSYGLSCDQIADVLERDSRTIGQWQKALGQKSRSVHLALCCLIGLTLSFLQIDEIWSYLKRKKRQLWVFITLEAQTKFWVNFELGSRTTHTANRLLKGIIYLKPWGFEKFFSIVTDNLAAYQRAIFFYLRTVQFAYLQIIKQRRNKRLVAVKKRLLCGQESDFPEKSQNTSYIERFNLTLRQRVSFLNRKTLGYCKNQNKGKWLMWINLFNYNYCQFHKSLREDLSGQPIKFQRRYNHLTPAMKMGLTTTQLTWRDLIVAPIAENAHKFPTSTVW
ncbi:IS1 family transposase [Gloeothece verrucosa]|uniref:IS1 transposase n=1 Tax=Gloeothece verrucosa (strain PCC 7822) TaxID=497965 RepID=E0UM47_GLOV7|nr:IS1 family transposase [Gloeothece verrucosa]ADN18027.1 IS1 transposase [Gloeothece verrucosa PCC 7822]